MATRTMIPDGLEHVPHDNLPEALPTPAGHEKGLSPGGGWAYAPPSPPEKKICGLRRTTALLLALLVAVIIAAAVGGGVGGSVAVRDAYDRGLAEGMQSSSSDSSSDSSTDSSSDSSSDSPSGSRIKAPPQEGRVELDCPALSSSDRDVEFNRKTVTFNVECGVNHAGGAGSVDLLRLSAYTFDDCLRACAGYNDLGVTNVTCVAAHFNSMLMNQAGGNCWLKSKIGDRQEVEDDQKNNLVEGYLPS